MSNQVVARVRRSLGGDAFPGVLLMGSTLLALLTANSVAAPLYRSMWEAPLSLGLGDLSVTKPLLLWVNDGLMAIFFLFVGLEIKREVVEGELSSWKQAALPLAAAVGGMLVPALLYLSVAGGTLLPGGGGSPWRRTSLSHSASWRFSARELRSR
jgi:NhaA family Na+:H+ antiporter